MQINIEIKNLSQVKAALARSPVVVSKHINNAIGKSIRAVRNKAIDLVPVDTGYLSGSITRGMSFSYLRGVVQPLAKYAYWVEVLPYRHTRGQSHYLQGSVDQTNQEINENFKTGLSDALSEIARSV